MYKGCSNARIQGMMNATQQMGVLQQPDRVLNQQKHKNQKVRHAPRYFTTKSKPGPNTFRAFKFH